MALKLTDGDYEKAADGVHLREVDGLDTLLQSAWIALRAERRRFYPDKEFGSRICQAQNEPLTETLTAYAAEALERVDGVYVVKTECSGSSAVFTLLLNGHERQVSIDLNDYLQ